MHKGAVWGAILALITTPAWAAKMAALINRDNYYDYATQYETQLFTQWAQDQNMQYEEVVGSGDLQQLFQHLGEYDMVIVDTNAIRDGAGYNSLFQQYKNQVKQWVENGGKLIVLGEYNAQLNPGAAGETGNPYEWLETFGITGVYEGPQHVGHDIGWMKANDPIFSGVTEQELEQSSTHPSGDNYWSVLRLVQNHPDANKWEILAKNDAGELLFARGKFGRGTALVTSWEIGYGQWAFGKLFKNTLNYAHNYGRGRPTPGPGLPETALVGLLALLALGAFEGLRRRKRIG